MGILAANPNLVPGQGLTRCSLRFYSGSVVAPQRRSLRGHTRLGALTRGGRFAAAIAFFAPFVGADKRYIEEEGRQGL